MFDFSFGELGVIGAVALIVLGPEKLPKVARTFGQWLGKAQRYVNDIKSDINREMELAELRKVQQQVQESVTQLQSSVQTELHSLEADLAAMRGDNDPWHQTQQQELMDANLADESNHTNAGLASPPSVESLAAQLAQLEQRLATQNLAPVFKYAPRARTGRAASRVRVTRLVNKNKGAR